MPAPTFNLPVFGTAPNRYTNEETLEAAVNNTLLALWNGVSAASGKSFRSRADAVAFSQDELPGSIGMVVTLENGVITWRVPFQSSDDPLFATSPYWGVLARVDVASALRDTGVMTLEGIGGTADAITASLPLAAQRNGVIATSGTSIVEIIPIATNSGTVEPTLSIDGGTPALIRSETGAVLAAGQLVAGRSYLLRRRNTLWRIVSGVAMADLAAARTDRIMADAQMGSPLLTDVTGTGNVVAASVPSILQAAGIAAANLRAVDLIWPADNIAGAVTLNIDGQGPVAVRDVAGVVPLAGVLRAGNLVRLVKDGSRWRIASAEARLSDLTAQELRSGVVSLLDVAGSANSITATLPNGIMVAGGLRVLLTPAVTNTGDVTLALSGGAAIQVRDAAGAQLAAGRLIAGRAVILQRANGSTAWNVVAEFISAPHLDQELSQVRADLGAHIDSVEDGVTALATDIALPMDATVGAEMTVLDVDAMGRAIRVMRDDGQDMHMSVQFWERGRDILASNASGLSTTAIQIISESGQSLSVGGAWVAGMSYEIAMSTAEPGAALMLAGLQHDEGGEVRLDGARSRSYNMAVHATGVRQAEPTPSILTGVFPLASMLNYHRRDAGLSEVPILATCHGIAGVVIEDMDDDPETGSGSTLIWDNMSFWYDEAKAVAAAADKTLTVPYHDWLHGTSASTAPAGQYFRRLWSFQQRYRALLAAKGISGDAIMVMGQPAGATNTSNAAVGWYCRDEVLQFCEAGGGILATAEHWFEISDNNVHPDALATALMQETRAWAVVTVEAGHRWTIHRPVVSTAEGVMTLDFSSLHEDEYLVAETAKYGGQGIDEHLGFELVGGVITSSELRGRQVLLTYTGAPTQLRYAYQQQDVTGFADNRYVAPRGVLRTSKTKLSKMVSGARLVRAIPAFRINL